MPGEPVIEGPFRAREGDFDSIVACGNECFPTEREAGGVLARWPHAYRREPEHLRRFLVMKCGGRVVSNVTYVDQTLAVDGAQLRVAGVAEVMTLPEFRGRGLMSRLLDRAIQCLAEEGYALSDLGGDRLRYGRYGWETARRVWHFSVSPRSAAAVPAPAGITIRKYSGDPAEVEAIASIHDAEPRRVIRDRAQHERLLGRLGRETHLAVEGRRVAAYLIMDPPGALATAEFGGSAEGVHALLLHALERLNGKSLTVSSPWAHPLNRLFLDLSNHWQISPARMIRLFDLAATLRAFLPQLHMRWSLLGLKGPRRVCLGVDESGERVALEFSDEAVRLAPAKEPDAIMLPRRAMVRFLFGPAAPSAVCPLPASAAFLDALMPLDFHIWPNEMV